MKPEDKTYTLNEVALMYIEAQSKLNQQIKLNWELQLKNEELLELLSEMQLENKTLREMESRFRATRQEAIDSLKKLQKGWNRNTTI